ncbi:MAG: hypothetical protein R3Y08_08325 [Rikenellaceae bacterium]
MSTDSQVLEVDAEVISTPTIRTSDLKFKSKSDVFDYFFVTFVNRGVEECEAAEKAMRMADIVAKTKSLPDVEPDVIDTWITRIVKLAEKAEQHPKITEAAIGLATGAGSLITALIASKTISEPEISDFDENADQVNFDEID